MPESTRDSYSRRASAVLVVRNPGEIRVAGFEIRADEEKLYSEGKMLEFKLTARSRSVRKWSAGPVGAARAPEAIAKEWATQVVR